MSNACNNSTGGPESRNQTADLLRDIIDAGPGFQKRADELRTAKKAADQAKAAAQAAEVHAQRELERMSQYSSDLKRNAEAEAARILAEAKAVIRKYLVEVEKVQP